MKSKAAEIIGIVSVIVTLWSALFMHSVFRTPVLIAGVVGFWVSIYLFYMRLVNAWRGNYNIDFRKKKIEESKAAEIIGIVSVIIIFWSAIFMHSVFRTPVLIASLIGGAFSGYLFYMRLVNAGRRNYEDGSQNKKR